MTLTLTLTPEKETWLQQQADRAGLPLDEYVLRALDQIAAAEASEPAPFRSLAEALAGNIGMVDGPEDLSEDTGRKFAALIQAKHDAGHL